MISNMSTPLTEPDIIHEIKDIELQILNLKAMKKKAVHMLLAGKQDMET